MTYAIYMQMTQQLYAYKKTDLKTDLKAVKLKKTPGKTLLLLPEFQGLTAKYRAFQSEVRQPESVEKVEFIYLIFLRATYSFVATFGEDLTAESYHKLFTIRKNAYSLRQEFLSLADYSNLSTVAISRLKNESRTVKSVNDALDDAMRKAALINKNIPLQFDKQETFSTYMLTNNRIRAEFQHEINVRFLSDPNSKKRIAAAVSNALVWSELLYNISVEQDALAVSFIIATTKGDKLLCEAHVLSSHSLKQDIEDFAEKVQKSALALYNSPDKQYVVVLIRGILNLDLTFRLSGWDLSCKDVKQLAAENITYKIDRDYYKKTFIENTKQPAVLAYESVANTSGEVEVKKTELQQYKHPFSKEKTAVLADIEGQVAVQNYMSTAGTFEPGYVAPGNHVSQARAAIFHQNGVALTNPRAVFSGLRFPTKESKLKPEPGKRKFHSSSSRKYFDRVDHQKSVRAKPYFIKPVGAGSRKNVSLKRLLVLDVETVAGTKLNDPENNDRVHTPLLIGLFDGERFKTFADKYPRSGENGISYRTVKYLVKHYKNYTVFAHNFSAFDLNFLLPALTLYMDNERKLGVELDLKAVIAKPSGNVITLRLEWYEPFTTKNKVKDFIEFRDSMNYFPGLSLERLGQAFLKEGKLELPFAWDTITWTRVKKEEKILEQIKIYNEQDCRLLYKVLRKFETSSFELLGEYPLNYYTLTSYSYHIFKTTLLPSKVLALGTAEDAFMRVGYHGGRTEVFRPYAKAGEGNFGLGFLDFTSLYPAVAVTFKMPTGYLSRTNKEETGKLGMYLCRVSWNNPENKIPLLPILIDSVLMYPAGTWYGTYATPEIEKARELGYKIEVCEGMYFSDSDFLFQTYFKKLLDQKEKARSEGKTDTAFLMKLFMNALTGRFGKKAIRTKAVILERDEHDRLVDTEQIVSHGSRRISHDSHYVLATVEDLVEPLNERQQLTESSVHLSAFITSYARVLLYEMITFPGVRPLYVDTDSCVFEKMTADFCTKNLNSYLEKKYNLLPDATVGRLHDVYENARIDEAIILAPKLYSIIYTQLEEKESKQMQTFTARGIRLKTKEQPADKATIDSWKAGLKQNLKTWELTTTVPLARIRGTLNIASVNADSRECVDSIKNQDRRWKLYKNGVWVSTVPRKLTLKKNKMEYPVVYLTGNLRRSWFKDEKEPARRTKKVKNQVQPTKKEIKLTKKVKNQVQPTKKKSPSVCKE